MASPLSFHAFARLVGVKQPSVTKAVATGRLVDSGGGIDPDHPLSVAYAELADARCRAKGWQPTPWARQQNPDLAPTPVQVRASPSPELDANGQPIPRAPHPPLSGGRNAPGRRPESRANDRLVFAVDANAKAIKAATEEINYRAKKLAHLRECGKTIETAERDRSLGAIVAVIENHLRPFADRVADQLAAMAGQPELRTPFADYLDSEIDKALTAAQAARDHEIQTSEQRNLVDEIDLDGPVQMDGDADTDTEDRDDADDTTAEAAAK